MYNYSPWQVLLLLLQFYSNIKVDEDWRDWWSTAGLQSSVRPFIKVKLERNDITIIAGCREEELHRDLHGTAASQEIREPESLREREKQRNAKCTTTACDGEMEEFFLENTPSSLSPLHSARKKSRLSRVLLFLDILTADNTTLDF